MTDRPDQVTNAAPLVDPDRLIAAAAARPYRRRMPQRLAGLLLNLVLIALGVLMIAPLVWLIVTAFTERTAAFTLPPRWIPQPFTLDNFAGISELIPFGRMALNSLIVAVLATAGALLTSLMAAYAFSRLQFRGRDLLFTVLLTALMVPVQLTVIPLFVLMRELNLMDTLVAVWLPACINVFGIFFLRQYLKSIPMELDEAARIDGAGHLRILFQVIAPLAKPALAALAILVFEASWNNFFWPSVFLRTPEKMTLPLGLVQLQGFQGGGPTTVLFAAITAVVVPVLVLFLIFQRSFVASIASTGLKA